MDNWITLIFSVAILAVMVWYAVKGLVKHPKEVGKGFQSDNWTSGSGL